jgi:ribosomal protein S18 acetylase RimI-like enzyme
MMIRRIQPEDVESFWKLRLKALKDHPDAFGASYEESKDTPIQIVRERLINSNTNFVIGDFTDAGELIGMVGFRQEHSKKMQHKGMIWGMYVDKSYQGQGIGKKLLTEIITIVDQITEIEQINLIVVDYNITAKRLYESLGFTTYGTEINAMKLNENTYVNDNHMVKKLER